MFAIVSATLLPLLAVFALTEPPFDGTVRKAADGSLEAFLKPPFLSNHAASIEILPDGTLTLAWFSGKQEEADNCSIVFSYLPPKSNQWTLAIVVALQPGYSNQNPLLFWDQTQSLLHLYYSNLKANAGEDAAQIWHTASRDNGKTWGALSQWYPISGAFTRNRIIPTLGGSLLFPVYNSTTSYPFMLVSDAAHTQWTRYGVPKANGLVQPTVVRLTPKMNNTLLCFFRDRNSQHVYSSTSTDEGKTWTDPRATVLPNNNAGIEAFQLASGATLLVFDNTNNKKVRTPLVVALSDDGGATWPHQRTLQAKDDAVHTGADTTVDPITLTAPNAATLEFSYPTVLQDATGAIHIAYTYDRLTIKYKQITEDWIKTKSTTA